MKKLYAFIMSAILSVGGVNAQGTYKVAEGVTPASGETVTSVENITMTWGTGGGWKKSKASTKIEGYDAYSAGGSNPTFDETNTLVPVSGAYVMFEPKVAGTITFAYKLNKNNKTQYFVCEDNTNVIDPIVNSDADNSVYLTTAFPVEAGKKYYTYTKGSKMDVFGFSFAINSTGISNIEASEASADAPLFNLAGQQVSKAYKGVVLQNGKKFIQK